MSLLYKMDKHLLIKLIENIENYESMSIEELTEKTNKIEKVLQRKIKNKRIKYVKEKLLYILKLPNFSHYNFISIVNFIDGIIDISVDSNTISFFSLSSCCSFKEDKEKKEQTLVFYKNLEYSLAGAPTFFSFLKERMIFPVRIYFHIWYSINEYMLKEVEVGWFLYDYVFSNSPSGYLKKPSEEGSGYFINNENKEYFLINKKNGNKYILDDENRIEFYFA